MFSLIFFRRLLISLKDCLDKTMSKAKEMVMLNSSGAKRLWRLFGTVLCASDACLARTGMECRPKRSVDQLMF